ncbi:hypothetical protein QBC47DRAFT_400275 [Echria macrotheca]|uniref:Uncharacterized protein n=1 Tax=Echria macrotheca TaxID=438768 RepID=A0AAJ0FCM1_9PEZI|nr:hypothetical protein QBC47DRAFT_400275 [Echria macrotheca]
MDRSHAQLMLDNLRNENLPNWSFTLYRTDYAPEHESKWTELLERINQAEHSDICTDEDHGTITTVPLGSVQRRIWDAFKLDVQSDKEQYSGVDIDTLRRIHVEKIRNQVGLASDADEDELHVAAPVQTWTILLADTEAEEHESHGAVRQDFWGWMRVKMGVLHDVWLRLQIMSGELHEIAPLSEEGPHAARVYDGDLRD